MIFVADFRLYLIYFLKYSVFYQFFLQLLFSLHLLSYLLRVFNNSSVEIFWGSIILLLFAIIDRVIFWLILPFHIIPKKCICIVREKYFYTREKNFFYLRVQFFYSFEENFGLDRLAKKALFKNFLCAFFISFCSYSSFLWLKNSWK